MTGFVYKWTYAPTLQYYIGVHKGHVDDGYIGSGRRFQAKWQLTEAEDWNREILFQGSYKECVDKEAIYVDDKTLQDPLCLNLIPGGRTKVEHLGWTNKNRSYRCKPQEIIVDGVTYHTRMQAVRQLRISFSDLDEIIESQSYNDANRR